MIRVIIVDDQTLVRQGIRSLLELAADVQVVGECGDGDQALAQVSELRPDVLLLDVRMPKRSGLEVLSELRSRGALPPTLLLTTFDDDAVVLEGVRAGAKGYLLKDVTLEELLDAIRALASGETRIRPAVSERVVCELAGRRGVEPPATDRLTERETEVLRLLGGGYSNREIALALSVAEGTIKNHVSRVLSKLGVRDRTRAVFKAIELGYL
jgi:DNA-binding NarL/FixJ family response regulator